MVFFEFKQMRSSLSFAGLFHMQNKIKVVYFKSSSIYKKKVIFHLYKIFIEKNGGCFPFKKSLGCLPFEKVEVVFNAKKFEVVFHLDSDQLM